MRNPDGSVLERTELARMLWQCAVRTWDPRYDSDARAQAAFAVGRIDAAVGEGRLDCAVSFERVPLDSTWKTNPLRMGIVKPGGYPGLRLALGRVSYDSIPLVVASSEGPVTLWDGHRRLETYRSAGRSDAPAWHARFSSGTGVVSVSPVAGTGTGSGSP